MKMRQVLSAKLTGHEPSSHTKEVLERLQLDPSHRIYKLLPRR